jgi:hypothetical protein
MSEVLGNAITGVAPDFTVDYANALVSKGSLTGVLNPVTDLATAGEVSFGWDNNTAGNKAKATDKAMLLAYNPSKKESASLLEGADRSTGSDVLTIPETYSGDTIYMFMAFISADSKTVSNSVYIGSGIAN